MARKTTVNTTNQPPKIFVLDTNIILHDHRSIYNFQNNDLYIPITVIEELDKFKKGNDTLAFNARSFVREIDRLSNNFLFDQGVSLGPGKGKIKVEIGHPFTGEYVGARSVAGGTAETVALIAAEDFVYSLADDEVLTLVQSGYDFVYAPVLAGYDAGYMYVLVQDQIVGKIPLVYGETIEQRQSEKMPFWKRLFGGLRN